jgi:hypothetical protein
MVIKLDKFIIKIDSSFMDRSEGDDPIKLFYININIMQNIKFLLCDYKK